MRVGMTYDLRDDYLAEGFDEEQTAEFDRADTIDSIDDALRALGYETCRIGHVRALVSRLAAGERWDLVFNIAEGMFGIGREAQVPALLDAFSIPYVFSDPVALSVTLHKAHAKRILRDAGLPTPDFALVSAMSQVDSVAIPYPLFAKPLAEGTGKGIDGSSRIESPADLQTACRRLLEKYVQPVLVESFLPGREFTVGIVGTGPAAGALGTLEVVLREEAESSVYSYVNKERCEELVDYILLRDPALAREAEQLALAAWRELECRDAGRVDLRADARGRLQILEVNPLAGIHPAHSDLPILATQLGIPYLDLIDRIMRSVLGRIGKPAPARLAGRGA
ncbi:MAG: D-alanine--D-alanine ligase [Deltaproteobacteria bacterium]|nr:D-alanine--D-alanine ligase [Deltaproteobacteria bacterium]